MMSDENFLAAFEATKLDPKTFNHEAHVRAGFLMVQQRGFAQAVPAYCQALKSFAASIGLDKKYHETITIAFLALINERLADQPDISWEKFCAHNPDILNKNALLAFYTPEQLASPAARLVFQLPRWQTS